MLQDDDFHRPNKRRVVARQIKSSSTWQLSSDILHQVLGFFLSARGVVDVEAIRSAMLVSKQWNEVVTSQSLWSIPQLHDEPFDSIRDALHIVDEGIVNNCREGEEMPSFIGFTKIEQMNCSFVDDSVVFRAVERSSRIPCLICVSPKDQVSDALLNHVFETHFFRGTFDFIPPFKNPRMTRKQFFLGIGQWGRRVIRWYVDGDIKSLTIPPVFCPQPSRIPLPLQEQELDSNEIISRKRMRLDYRHLQYLERSQTESLSDHLSRQSWALIVDWLIEITMCFSLDSRIPFHSMDLLRRFVSRMKGGLTRGKYQLLASACMLIATKCNMANMRPADFRYCSDNLFTVEELCDAEAMVLGVLQWSVAQPTIIDFVYAFAEHSDVGSASHELYMISYLSDLALQSHVHMDLKASQIAACIVVLALFCLSIPEKPLWKEDYFRLTGFSFNEVCDGVVILSRRLDEIRTLMPNLRVIDRRHCQLTTIPSVASSAVLQAYQTKMTRATVPN